MTSDTPVVPYKMNPQNVDFEGMFDALNTEVQNSDVTTGAWTDALAVATGAFILRLVAGTGAGNQFALERTQHELFYDTARRPTSLYAIARMQGVHIQRKQPAAVPVQIVRPTPDNLLIIPAYTVWTIGSVPFFNREDVYLAAGTSTVSISLFQGQLVTETRVSDGSPFQRYLLGNSDFAVSDVDVYALIGTPALRWTAVTDGLWEYTELDNIFYQNSAIDGRVEIRFGNDIHGAAPPAGTIEFHYAVVDNARLTSANILVGAAVSCSDFSYLLTYTTGAVGSQVNERNPEFYRIMGPALADKAVVVSNRANYRAASVQLPGVLDARIQGQAETNPGDLRHMNAFTVTLLTSSPWTDSDWSNYVQIMTDAGLSTVHLVRRDPIPVAVDIQLELHVQNRANLTSVEQQGETLIRALFAPGLDSLGATYAIQNLGYLVKQGISDPYGGLVDYANVILPYQNVVLSPISYAVIRNLSVKAVYTSRSAVRIVQGVAVPAQVPYSPGI